MALFEADALRERFIGTRPTHGRYQLIRRKDLPRRLPRRSRNVPPRHLWPRKSIPRKSMPTCRHCGRVYIAASTHGAITYYRRRCACAPKALRKVERPIDWELMQLLFILDPHDLPSG